MSVEPPPGLAGKPPPGLEHAGPGQFEDVLKNELGYEEVKMEKTLTKEEVENYISQLSNSKVEGSQSQSESDWEEEEAKDEDDDFLQERKRKKGCLWYGAVFLILAIVGGGAAVGALFATGVFDSAQAAPTLSPTNSPTFNPTNAPTLSPVPTPEPTSAPSSSPSVAPTPPTQTPTSSPSIQPTTAPTQAPTSSPTPLPTEAPTQLPTSSPSFSPLSSAELKSLINDRLRLTFGWSDVCGNGCTAGPFKFTTLFDSSCFVTGVDSNCVPVLSLNKTFGAVNLDGAIGNDDRLYLQLNASSLSCGLGSDAACATGTPEQRAIYAMGFLCVAIGWSDTCSGCTTPPARLSEWCVDTSLSTTQTGTGTLPGSVVLDGVPGDDDNFYISAYVHPTAPALPLLDYARANCHVTLGWRDVCNGCFDPPAKRGSVGFDGTCFDVVGTASLCVGSYASVNTDGALSDDDTFYVAFTCD